MPSLPIEASHKARDAAFELIERATGTGSRVSSAGRGVRSTARVISGGVIAAIVIGCIVAIVAIILAIFFFRRHKKRRQMREKEMQKYYGDNRSSMGSSNYNPNNATNPQGGYNYGQGYGYGHTATPGQYGYGAPDTGGTGGVAGVPPAYTADHVTTK